MCEIPCLHRDHVKCLLYQSNEMQPTRTAAFVSSVLLCSCVSCLKITPNDTELTFTKGAAFTLTCENDMPVEWKFPEYEAFDIDSIACNASTSTIENGTVDNGTYISILKKENACYMDTGYYWCMSRQKNATLFSEQSVYIFVQDAHHLFIDTSTPILSVDEFGDVVIPCRPTSPDVVPLLRIADTGEEMENITYDPKIGFTKKSPTVSDSVSVLCEVDGQPVKDYQLFIQPMTAKISRPFIDASGAYHAVEGSHVVLICKVSISYGDIVFISWKYPNPGLHEKIIDSQQEELTGDSNQVMMNIKSITIVNLSKSDEGDYICEVSDMKMHTETATYHLTVHDQNSTFLHLAIQEDKLTWTVNAGQSSFQWIVNVTSYPRSGVTWFDPSGKEISQTSKYSISFDGRYSKLVINRIDINDSGAYTILASNTRMKRELKLTLLVKDKPEIQKLHDQKLYTSNEIYKIQCTVTAYPLPRIKWYSKNCHNYPNCGNEPFKLIPAKNYQELAVHQYRLKSELTFSSNESVILRCDAENEHGFANATTRFLVTDVVEGFAASASPDVITVQDDITLSCGASKYYYYRNITWLFNNTKLNQFTPVKRIAGIQITNTSTSLSYGVELKIIKASKNFTGQYLCNAHSINETSTIEAKLVNVKVQDVLKPTWIFTNLNGTTQKTKTEKQVKFECIVKGLPKPEITWFKNKAPLQLSANETRIQLHKNNQTLFIRYTSLTDEGLYTCVAANKAGNISASEMLYFTDKPDEHGHLILVVLCAIPTFICGTCIIWLAARIQKERKLRKELAETGLLNFEEGAVGSLNPELGVEDQADLLPYDRRWEFSREKLTFGKQLGSGAFGVVMKAEADGIIDENTTTTVAVKMVKRGADPLHIRALASELKIMIHLGRHLNVVNLLGACTRDIYKRELVVIVEYCKYGNLHDFLLKQRNNFINQVDDEGHLDFSITDLNKNSRYSAMTNSSFMSSVNNTSTGTEITTLEETPIGSDGYLISKDTEPDWRSNYKGDYRNTIVRPIKTSDLICWSFQIARGMEYLASRKVLHGDLAARNVLLADDNIVKICDFGLAKSMYNNDNYQRKRHELLPVRWMAVESIRDRVFSIQSDVWSFGITMWELFSLSITPYPGVEHLETLYTKLSAGYRLEQPAYATKEIHAVMMDCWHVRPTLRPTFIELSERLGTFLEDGVRSHYTNLNEMYLKMNEDMNNAVDYLALLNPPVYTAGEEPRYVNVPTRESPELEEDVELKPMLPSSENKYTNVNPISFLNPSYAPLTRPT